MLEQGFFSLGKGVPCRENGVSEIWRDENACWSDPPWEVWGGGMGAAA